jgi:hypothetical protein
MARGIKYNASFKLPDGSFKQIDNKNMKELISSLNNEFQTHYYLEPKLIKLTPQVIYNMHKRPQRLRAIIRDKIVLQRL